MAPIGGTCWSALTEPPQLVAPTLSVNPKARRLRSLEAQHVGFGSSPEEQPSQRGVCLPAARYQRSTYCPTSRPTMAMRPVASVYQIATNSGESFIQCIAKTVAPKAPARRPAAAPATAGDIGAP